MNTARRALVVGGTSGIGKAIATRLAKMGAHVTIVGRNRQSAESVVASVSSQSQDAAAAPSTNATAASTDTGVTGRMDYILADMSLVANAVALAREFEASNQRLDYLVVTAGIMKIQGRVETSEGLDEKMATHYYARQALIHSLAPLLERSATGAGLDGGGRVLNVLAATKGCPPPDMGDLDLKRTFSIKACADATTFYTDLATQSLALAHPTVSFIYAYPGVVNTNITRNMWAPLRWLMAPLMALQLSEESCGEAMTRALLSNDIYFNSSMDNSNENGGMSHILTAGKNWALVNERGERYPDSILNPLFYTDEMRMKIDAHTREILKPFL